MRKTLRNLVLAGALATGIGTGCAPNTIYFVDNYETPEAFYAPDRNKSSGLSNAELMTTLGVIVSTKADTENEALLGTAITNIGAIRAQKEAAEAGRANVNVQQNVTMAPTPAVADATAVPEYNLEMLPNFYRDGHLLFKWERDNWGEVIGLPLFEERKMVKIDGIQYIFTYNRKVDLDGNGFSFGEFMGVKRNFQIGEPLEICVGLSESSMTLRKPKGAPKKSPNGYEPTNATLNLRILNEENELLYETQYREIFHTPNQRRLFFWRLDDLNLNQGFYIVEADYSDNYDAERVVDADFFLRDARILERRIKTLRQFFQIYEK